MAKSGSTLAESTFTAPGGVGAGVADQVSDDKLVRLFADGATMVLQGLHRVWPPILAFSQQLAAELGHPVQANAYVTPPQNQGFSDHYDVHDVFVLQIAGEKRWSIHAPVLEAPLRSQPWTDRRRAVEQQAQQPPLIEAVLRPGDCLYLPRGFLHAAVALGGVSTHLTIGVHSWTRYALAEQLLDQALRTVRSDPACGSRCRWGSASTIRRASPRTWRRRVRRWSPRCSAPTSTRSGRTLQGAARGTSRAAPVGPLAQLQAADSPRRRDVGASPRAPGRHARDDDLQAASCAAGPVSWCWARRTSPRSRPCWPTVSERPATSDWTWPGGCCWPEWPWSA